MIHTELAFFFHEWHEILKEINLEKIHSTQTSVVEDSESPITVSPFKKSILREQRTVVNNRNESTLYTKPYTTPVT